MSIPYCQIVLNNVVDIDEKGLGGCVCCRSLISQADIKEVKKDGNNISVCCPKCGVPAIIPASKLQTENSPTGRYNWSNVQRWHMAEFGHFHYETNIGETMLVDTWYDSKFKGNVEIWVKVPDTKENAQHMRYFEFQTHYTPAEEPKSISDLAPLDISFRSMSVKSLRRANRRSVSLGGAPLELRPQCDKRHSHQSPQSGHGSSRDKRHSHQSPRSGRGSSRDKRHSYQSPQSGRGSLSRDKRSPRSPPSKSSPRELLDASPRSERRKRLSSADEWMAKRMSQTSQHAEETKS